MIRQMLCYWKSPMALMRAAWTNVIGMWCYRLLVLPRIIRRVSKKERVNVIFIAINVSMWRYDGVYRRMRKDPRFNPRILIAPRLNESLRERIRDQRETFIYLNSKGYLVDCAYDEKTGEWIDLDVFEPDIIFYAQHYVGVIPHKYEFSTVRDVLFCYAPYSYQLSVTRWNYDTPCQNYCWLVFLASEYQKQIAAEISRISACNVVPVGYSFYDEYLDVSKDRRAGELAWRNDSRKRIIWAPHHSIDPKHAVRVSSFLDIAELMLRLRDKYRDRIIIAFKPHPMLYSTLCRVWGEERASAYFEKWKNSENSFLADADYHALFAGSDAMIHCSISFIVEYLYTEKPVQYVYSKTRERVNFGEIGERMLNAHYPAYEEQEIIDFLENVVLSGIDPKETDRKSVKQEWLMPPNGKTFAENVCNMILTGLGKS